MEWDAFAFVDLLLDTALRVVLRDIAMLLVKGVHRLLNLV
jgi:hypothetical protein